MNWLQKMFAPKSTSEIQAELKALCEKIVLMSPTCFLDDIEEYERLTKELYKRGVEPETRLSSKKNASSL
jgi:hypothetical protein